MEPALIFQSFKKSLADSNKKLTRVLAAGVGEEVDGFEGQGVAAAGVDGIVGGEAAYVCRGSCR